MIRSALYRVRWWLVAGALVSTLAGVVVAPNAQGQAFGLPRRISSLIVNNLTSDSGTDLILTGPSISLNAPNGATGGRLGLTGPSRKIDWVADFGTGEVTFDVENSNSGDANNAAASTSLWGFDHVTKLGQVENATSAYITGAPNGDYSWLNTEQTAPLYLGTNSTASVRLPAAGGVEFYDRSAGAFIDVSAQSGHGTATFDDACTTSPTLDYDYQRVGNFVLLIFTNNISTCTSDSTNYATTGAPIPAALRPSTTSQQLMDTAGGSAGGANVGWKMQITTAGNITFQRCTAFGTACGGWLNDSMAKVVTTIGRTYFYMLGDP